MAEHDVVTVRDQKPGAKRLVELGDHLACRATRNGGHVAHRHTVADNRSDPQESKRWLRQVPQAADHELPERCRQVRRGDLDRGSLMPKSTLLRQRAKHLDHPQRIAARLVEHRRELPSGRRAKLVTRHRLDIVRCERVKSDKASTGRENIVEELVERPNAVKDAAKQRAAMRDQPTRAPSTGTRPESSHPPSEGLRAPPPSRPARTTRLRDRGSPRRRGTEHRMYRPAPIRIYPVRR